MTEYIPGHLYNRFKAENKGNILETDDLLSDLEKDMSEIDLVIENFPLNITELLSKRLTEKEKIALPLLRKFCGLLTNDFQQGFDELMAEYIKNRRPVAKQIIEYVKEIGFDQPRFTIADEQNSRELLRKFNLMFSDQITPGNLLLTYNLPKPLAHYWWKSGNYFSEDDKKQADQRVIEWGHFYYELTPIIWRHVDSQIINGKLNLVRLNNLGEHDASQFYYVWEVSIK